MQQKLNYLMYNDNMTFIYNYCNISFCKKYKKF